MNGKYILIIGFLLVSSVTGFSRSWNKGNRGSNEVATIESKVIGYVVDRNTGEAIVGAKVKIEGENQEAYTDFDGQFEFTNLRPGTYTIICNMVTYEDFKINKVEVGVKGEKSHVTFRLSPVSIAPKTTRKYPSVNLG